MRSDMRSRKSPARQRMRLLPGQLSSQPQTCAQIDDEPRRLGQGSRDQRTLTLRLSLSDPVGFDWTLESRPSANSGSADAFHTSPIRWPCQVRSRRHDYRPGVACSDRRARERHQVEANPIQLRLPIGLSLLRRCVSSCRRYCSRAVRRVTARVGSPSRSWRAEADVTAGGVVVWSRNGRRLGVPELDHLCGMWCATVLLDGDSGDGRRDQ